MKCLKLYSASDATTWSWLCMDVNQNDFFSSTAVLFINFTNYIKTYFISTIAMKPFLFIIYSGLWGNLLWSVPYVFPPRLNILYDKPQICLSCYISFLEGNDSFWESWMYILLMSIIIFWKHWKFDHIFGFFGQILRFLSLKIIMNACWKKVDF